MVLLNSEPIALGAPAPDFSLRSVDGRPYRLSDFAQARALVVMFICAHCPYVKAVEQRILDLSRDFGPRGVQFLGICSNDSSDYPEDSPESLLKLWKEKNYSFPYLIDAEQDVAKAYGAVCTPDLYVYDAERKLVYHGRIDDSWKDAGQVRHQELRQALEALLKGERPSTQQHPSLGCSIKWKK